MDVIEKGMDVMREVWVGREGGWGRGRRCLRWSIEVVCDGKEGGVFSRGGGPYRVFHDGLQGTYPKILKKFKADTSKRDLRHFLRTTR